jgi:hypothetical protein
MTVMVEGLFFAVYLAFQVGALLSARAVIANGRPMLRCRSS